MTHTVANHGEAHSPMADAAKAAMAAAAIEHMRRRRDADELEADHEAPSPARTAAKAALVTAVIKRMGRKHDETADADADREESHARRGGAAAGFAKAAVAAAALKRARRKAGELSDRAHQRARSAVDDRRALAASRLEDLAGRIRPAELGRSQARGRKLAIAGGSSAALAAALGVGVALGFYLSRQVSKRRAGKAQAGAGQVPVAAAEPSLVLPDEQYVGAAAALSEDEAETRTSEPVVHPVADAPRGA